MKGVYGEKKSVAAVARDFAPSRDHENPKAMKRHEATISKRLHRARQRLFGHAINLLDARRHQNTEAPTLGTFTDAGLYAAH